MKIIYLPLLLVLLWQPASSCFAQDPISKEALVSHFNFKERKIRKDAEPITFYEYNNNSGPKRNLIIYLQGSDPSPLFTWTEKDNNIQKYCHIPRDFKLVGDDYLFVTVEKVGFEVLKKYEDKSVPQIYHDKNSLDDRVIRADAVIDKLITEHDFERVIVYGHSEGAPVAAKLATENKQITHLGFWCGNLLPDFFDFILESRIAYHKGEISVEEAQDQINRIIEGFVKEIATDTANTEGGGYTKLRWWSYAEPPLNHLLKTDIPIFMLVGTNDTSAPIESSYLAPLEFARLKKDNLHYRVCTGCNHDLNIIDNDNTIRKWRDYFAEFIDWIKSSK